MSKIVSYSVTALMVVALSVASTFGACKTAKIKADVGLQAVDPATVLKIAGSGQAGAKEQIVNVSKAAARAEVRELARAIIRHWSDELNTYSATSAEFLSYEPVSPRSTAFAVVEVIVNANGQAVRISFAKLDPTDAEETLKTFLMNRIYLPARMDGQYRISSASVLIRPEVHP